jgi:microcystin-dependent protein
VSVSAAVVLFASLGGAGLAQTALAPARGLVTQDQGGQKVEICHKGKKTISISVNAVLAHLRHGDTENECAVVVQATDTTSTAKAKKGEKKQSTESAEEPATAKTKKPKVEKGAKSASAGGQEKAKLAKGKSKKKAAAGTPDEANIAPATPKKLKPAKSKGGSASPPGLGGASPPGHANVKGNGKKS